MPGAMLRARAPGKINLSLRVGPLRADGRHELVTLIESLSLADELTLSVAAAAAGGDGLADEIVCATVDRENLAATALARFRAQTGWSGPRLRLEIEKRVPVAAGMGGGSADAAAALRLALAVSGVAPGPWLMQLAAGLGADVPSQLEPGPVLATGAGDVVEPLAPLEPHCVLVLPPRGSLSTAAVYAEADRLGLGRSVDELRDAERALRAALARSPPIEDLLDLLGNDLEPAARSLHPAIDVALADARAVGAALAIVSGSGPTVVGLFLGEEGFERASHAASALAGRHPGAVAAAPVAADFGAARR